MHMWSMSACMQLLFFFFMDQRCFHGPLEAEGSSEKPWHLQVEISRPLVLQPCVGEALGNWFVIDFMLADGVSTKKPCQNHLREGKVGSVTTMCPAR